MVGLEGPWLGVWPQVARGVAATAAHGLNQLLQVQLLPEGPSAVRQPAAQLLQRGTRPQPWDRGWASPCVVAGAAASHRG